MKFTKGHIPWHKGKTDVYSEETLKKMSEKKKGVKGYWSGKKRSSADKEKMSKAKQGLYSGNNNPMYGKRGKLAPNWKGGISEEKNSIRSSAKMKEWRVKVFQRDGYNCRRCGQHGGQLEAHHGCFPVRKLIKTKFEKYLYELQNGITLCKRCHNLIPKKDL